MRSRPPKLTQQMLRLVPRRTWLVHERPGWGLLVSWCLAGAVSLAATNDLSSTNPPPTNTNSPGISASGGRTNSPPPTTPTVSANDFSSFRLIAERNIFNPARTRRSKDGDVEKPAPPKIDVVSLAGTLISARGQVAFFDSGSEAFRKSIKRGERIAGYLLQDIQQTQIVLSQGEQTLTLKVGEQLRREDEGAWQITSGVEITAVGSGVESNSSPGSDQPVTASAGSPATPTAEEPGGGSNDALKRLLEKRRKEQSQ